jgi:hypothetical protein
MVGLCPTALSGPHRSVEGGRRGPSSCRPQRQRRWQCCSSHRVRALEMSGCCKHSSARSLLIQAVVKRILQKRRSQGLRSDHPHWADAGAPAGRDETGLKKSCMCAGGARVVVLAGGSWIISLEPTGPSPWDSGGDQALGRAGSVLPCGSCCLGRGRGGLLYRERW